MHPDSANVRAAFIDTKGARPTLRKREPGRRDQTSLPFFSYACVEMKKPGATNNGTLWLSCFSHTLGTHKPACMARCNCFSSAIYKILRASLPICRPYVAIGTSMSE